MNPSTLTASPPPRRGPSPVGQTLAIVLIVLAGLLAGGAILRLKTATPPAEAGEEAEHGHDAKGEDPAAGRVEMNEAKRKSVGLSIESAGPAPIRTTLTLYGKAAANEEALAHVSPRFPGIVKAVKKRLGDPVARGEILAVVESNDTLRFYDVKSEIAGTITAKDATLGELVNDQTTMFTVTDLATVWIDLNVYREDFSQLKMGQRLLVGTTPPDAKPIETEISYLSPFGAENTQSMLARAVVPNPGGVLRPGLFVEAQAVLDVSEVSVAVRAEAVQTLDGKPVVFVQEGDRFEARPVELGRRDADRVEITAGLAGGERYAAANSFLLKAEIGKANAHED